MGTNFLLEYGSHIIILFLCQPVHEWAHAWSAYKLGDDTAARQGRLTLNPIAHMDPIGTLGILFCGFGWGKPVPVNPAKFDRKYTMRGGMALTAAAGPLSNIVMALLVMIVSKFITGAYLASYKTGTPNEALMWLCTICDYIIFLNICLAVFNLIPIGPLDGQKILSYFLPARIGAKLDRYQFKLTIGLLFLLTFTNLLNAPMSWLRMGVLWLCDKLTFWVDPLVNIIFK